MSYFLRGSTTAQYGNPDHSHTLAGATLVFYRAGERAGGSAVRWGWKPVDEGGMRVPELGRALVAQDGSYEAELREPTEGSLLVALSVKRFDFTPETGHSAYGLLGVVQPEWSRGDEAPGVKAANIDVVVRAPTFADILETLDLWLVAGRVSDCATGQTPLVAGTVTAFDRDISEDDTLGTATTDSTGSFSIFVPSDLFEAASVLPAPHDHVMPHELFGGPDLYFHVSKGASTLLEEAPSLGRGPDRENIGRCSFTTLGIGQLIWAPQSIPLWTHIGELRLKGADSDGSSGGSELIYTGLIDLGGQLSQTWMGAAVRYRFLFAVWKDPDTAPAWPEDYAPLLAANLDLMAPNGALYAWTGPTPWDFSTSDVLCAPDGEGWISVDLRGGFLRDTGRLVRLDTATLIPAEHADLALKVSLVFQVQTDDGTWTQPTPAPVLVARAP